MFKNILFFSMILFLAACTKETMKTIENEPNPTIGDVPVIELLQVTPTTAQQYVDSIAFTIQYQDGDGDLGNADPDIPSIKLIDNRDPGLLIFEYHLSPRSPEGSQLAIQGELTIVLANSILLDDSNQLETTTFSISVTDRAGNESNLIETETITITQ
jgi:hypothetical protein